MTKHLIRAALALLLTAPFAVHAQNKPIDFNPKMPFSNGFVAGNTLYVAGQQGPERLMPNPKPARATVKVAGLIGDAKIEISAIAVKQ
jgi:enamine deaminase RidA (YjgF/YER057c/UK114 family)